jgi:hypothetical protein
MCQNVNIWGSLYERVTGILCSILVTLLKFEIINKLKQKPKYFLQWYLLYEVMYDPYTLAALRYYKTLYLRIFIAYCIITTYLSLYTYLYMPVILTRFPTLQEKKKCLNVKAQGFFAHSTV